MHNNNNNLLTKLNLQNVSFPALTTNDERNHNLKSIRRNTNYYIIIIIILKLKKNNSDRMKKINKELEQFVFGQQFVFEQDARRHNLFSDKDCIICYFSTRTTHNNFVYILMIQITLYN